MCYNLISSMKEPHLPLILAMEAVDEVTSRRIHIGNISPRLAENGALLEARLAKFGPITKPLLFHTKPVNDFYFAFVEINLSEKLYDKLKTALNGMLFMGRKLTVSLAKPDFQQAWTKDSKRPGPTNRVLAKQEGIARARGLRIAESQTLYPSNAILGAPLVKTSLIGANNSTSGYSKSAHTYNNASANTKNKSPAHDLVGAKSYGSSLTPRGAFSQQTSHTSGGGEVIKGRIRKTPRPEIYFVRKQQTMRILINGEHKQIKCYKTKLWGVEKNKTARDLTYRFHNNAWRSGDDHIVERVEVKKLALNKCGVDGAQAEAYGSQAHHEKVESDDEDEATHGQEQATNASVLAKLFTSYDFDKPVELENVSEEEDVTYDSKGRRTVKGFDYEAQGVVDFDNEDADQDDQDLSEAKKLIENFKQSHSAPLEAVCYDEDDEGNELDLDTLGEQYATEAIKKKYDNEHGFEVDEEMEEEPEASNDVEAENEAESEDSSDEDLMPKFAQPTNNTETLRSLFNQEKSDTQAGFSLALEQQDEDDIDEEAGRVAEEERQKLLEQIKSKQSELQQEAVVAAGRGNLFGLFWTHFDSPFLQTQTQLSKIGHTKETVRLPGEEEDANPELQIRDEGHGDEDAYERWFWSVRGEVGRECKRRKRDVMRMFKKKSTKPSV